MAKELNLQEFQANSSAHFATPSITSSSRIDRPTTDSPTTATVAPTTEDAAPTITDRPVWEPIEPQFTKAIADYYQIDGRTVQRTRKKIQEALPWLSEGDLKLPDERYTPLCVKLMGNYWQSRLRLPAWKVQIWEDHPEEVKAYLELQSVQSENPLPESPAIRPDVLLPQNEPQGDRATESPHLSGMVLHLGDRLMLPVIGSIVPGNDTAYLTQMEQRLQQFEAMQQQMIAQMQQRQQQAETLNAQFQEGMSLSDQLILKEYQLRGFQLGSTAIHLKQQAFKAAVQAAEAGTTPMPGKPQSHPEPAPSA